MKAEVKKRLSRLGIDTLTIDALDKLPELIEEFQVLDESNGYSKKVNALIRKRYSMSQELAILRKRDVEPDEFRVYNEYVEWCIEEAKKDE